MTRKTIFTLLVAVLAAASAGCGGSSGSTADTASTQAETTASTGTSGAAGGGQACGDKATIGYMGPTTGPVASIGEELRQWALFYVSQWNDDSSHKLKFDVVEGDDQFDPAQVSTIAQQFVSNDKILGVLGPGSSPEVEAAAPIYASADMAYIAATATRTSLTDGKHPGFFRIAPPDSLQAQATTNYMVDELNAKKVAIFDDQSAYSAPLADEVEKLLKAAGVDVSRGSVSQNQTDYSSVITKIADGTDLVYLPFTVPAKMQLFGKQMKEQGKDIVLFAGDAGFSPEFSIENARFSTFAPDIRNIPADKDLIDEYFAKYGSKAPLTTYGPPSYVAAQALLAAVDRACSDGEASRAEVRDELLNTQIDDSILGRPISFTPAGESEGASFVIFQIKNGKPVFIK